MFEDDIQQAKDKILGVNDKIDGKVDAKIDQAQESRFSYLVFGGAALALLVLIGLLAAY